ncbi:MAG TPA: LPS assembly lipoprotein LptE [Gemmatimonadaceae bacterium]|nr:LPS assembly lipoprotein LptE [Gemmatimonadaceae bacterium]
MRRSGIGSVLFAALLAGCFPYGFAGGGLPGHVRTVAVLPFDNETSQSEIQRDLVVVLRRAIERRLGLRDASQDRAHAVVRGTILRYDADVPVGFSADPSQATSARRKLQIAVDIEIVDQTTGRTLWSRRSLLAEGEYNEGNETDGRRIALEKLVNEVIEGAQSQW